jgi:hypothetical protein
MATEASPVSQFAAQLAAELTEQYGPLMGAECLCHALGYRSLEAFRLALSRGTVPVPVFPIAKRRGKYALTKEVAFWLAEQRAAARVRSPVANSKEVAMK